MLGRLVFWTGLHRRLMRGYGFVTVFHSVVREAPFSALRCSEADFVAFCGFFRRYFRVVPLAQLVSSLRGSSGPAGLMSISFDDGYADNAEIAAPVLRAAELPATFFVVTDFIGSEQQATWDERHGVRSRWMRWQEVRELAAAGFEIGAHSTRHQDMASIDREQLDADIAKSRATLLEHTGRAPHGFAYPFGSLRHMNPHAPEILRRHEFEYCVLAQGGLVDRATDPLEVPRIPVGGALYADPYALGFELVRAALSAGRRPPARGAPA